MAALPLTMGCEMGDNEIKPVVLVRWTATGDYGFPAEQDAQGEFVSYDEAMEVFDRMTAEIADANGKIDRFMGAWERFRIRKNSEFWEMKEECDEAKRKLSVAVAEVAALKHLLSAAMEKEQTNG